MKSFVLKYIAYSALLYALIALPPFKDFLNIESGYTNFVTLLSSNLALLFGIASSVNGNIIMHNGFALKILFGCSGLEALLIFLAGIFAFTASVRAKLAWAVGGVLLLMVINLFRIVLLLYVGFTHPNFFDLLHTYVTQSVMIFLAIALFVLFVRQSSREQKGVLA